MPVARQVGERASRPSGRSRPTRRRRAPPASASPATSEPAPGSLKSWHQISSLVAMPRRNRCLTSSLPHAMTVGPPMPMPMMLAGRGTPVVVEHLVDGRGLTGREREPGAVLGRPRRRREPRLAELGAPLRVVEVGPQRRDLRVVAGVDRLHPPGGKVLGEPLARPRPQLAPRSGRTDRVGIGYLPLGGPRAYAPRRDPRVALRRRSRRPRGRRSAPTPPRRSTRTRTVLWIDAEVAHRRDGAPRAQERARHRRRRSSTPS